MSSFGLTITNLIPSCRPTLLPSYLLSKIPNRLAFLSSSLPQNGCSRSCSLLASYGKPCTQSFPRADKRGPNSSSREMGCTFYPYHCPGRITFVSPHSKAGFKVSKICATDSQLAVSGQRQPGAEAIFSHRISRPHLSLRVAAPSHLVSE